MIDLWPQIGLLWLITEFVLLSILQVDPSFREDKFTHLDKRKISESYLSTPNTRNIGKIEVKSYKIVENVILDTTILSQGTGSHG